MICNRNQPAFLTNYDEPRRLRRAAPAAVSVREYSGNGHVPSCPGEALRRVTIIISFFIQEPLDQNLKLADTCYKL